MRYSFLYSISLCTLLFLTGCHRSRNGEYSILDYGAPEDSTTDAAPALQSAIDACAEAGGGMVTIPAGRTFLCSPFTLRSYVNLHLEPSAKLLANPDPEAYTHSAFRDNRGEGMTWIYGENIHGASITGQGTLDGNAVAFMGKELGDSYELLELKDPAFDPRPHVLTLVGGSDFTMREVTVANSAYWTVHLVGIHRASIVGINILNSLKVRNSDGIDLDHCRDVRIADCFIRSGDDCICLKNRREFEEFGPCTDITVTNCTMASRSCAIKIGSENMDSIARVLFNNCIIRQSNRGVGIQNRDEGTVTDVQFSHMIVDCRLFSDVWWGKAEPIYVTSYPRAVGNHKDAGWRFPKGATEGRCGNVSHITFSDIFCTSPNGIFIGCDEPGKVSDIALNNVDLHLVESAHEGVGLFDRRPCLGEGFLGTEGEPQPLYVDGPVTGLTLKDCRYDLGNSGWRPLKR